AIEAARTPRFRMLGIEVIDDDEVEIRARRHLVPAELPQREDRGLLPCDAAMQVREMLFDRAVKRANERIRQPGEGLARLLRRHGSRENARPDQEHLLLREDAEANEEVLIRPGLAQRALEGGRELGFFRQRAEEARVDDRVHDLRKLSEAVGEPWRGAKHE